MCFPAALFCLCQALVATVLTLALFYFGFWLPHCAGLPGFLANVTDLVAQEGYAQEWYDVVTSDGYVLPVLRLPAAKDGTPASRGPVMLLHGQGATLGGLVVMGSPRSVAYDLADVGYDVWIPSVRGDGYAMSREDGVGPTDPDFWKFSWDEMATLDLPALVDFTLSVSGASTTALVGFSQGSTISFAGLSELGPAFGAKISALAAVAPVVYASHQRSWVLWLAARSGLPLLRLAMGVYVEPISPDRRRLLACVGQQAPDFVYTTLGPIMGPVSDPFPPIFDTLYTYATGPDSQLNTLHWSQAFIVNRFQKLDLGLAGNLERYGQPLPPAYDLKNGIPPSLPIGLFRGSEDYLVAQRDIDILKGELPSPVAADLNVNLYDHADTVLGAHIDININPAVVAFLLNNTPSSSGP